MKTITLTISSIFILLVITVKSQGNGSCTYAGIRPVNSSNFCGCYGFQRIFYQNGDSCSTPIQYLGNQLSDCGGPDTVFFNPNSNINVQPMNCGNGTTTWRFYRNIKLKYIGGPTTKTSNNVSAKTGDNNPNPQNENANTLDLYPNPSGGQVNLLINSNIEGVYEIIVVNTIGQRIMEQKNNITANNNKVTLEVDNFPQGLYYVLVLQNDTQIKLTTSFFRGN